VPWVSKDEQTGITVPPRNKGALTVAINILINNPDIRKEYGRNARKRIESRFDKEVLIDKVFKKYREVAGN
jgi:rhamnosyl/mannosyltransferase